MNTNLIFIFIIITLLLILFFTSNKTNDKKKNKINNINVNTKKNNIKKVKKYAVYFPQFHEIKENNTNFYDGFTDIVSLNDIQIENKETPNLKLLGLNNILEYDLYKNNNLLNKQIQLLNKYNIDGFAMYYYWFSINTITNKKRIMYDINKKFLNIPMGNKKIFYIWANENWSDNSAFGNSDHIIKNTYEDNFEHCNELIKDFKSKNYLKIDNKPVFYIHHPWEMSENQIKDFKNRLNNLCLKNGFNGIIFKLNNIVYNRKGNDYYDFHPNYKRTKNSTEKVNNQIKLNYQKYINKDLIFNSNVQTIFFDFDNRPRLYKPDRLHKSTVCINNTKDNHIKYINAIKNYYNSMDNIDNDAMILINAWNEWGEKMYLEPSEQNGSYYLELLYNNL